MNQLIFVTKNKNKLADAQKLLPDYEIENVKFDVPEIQSLDPKEIAQEKLRIAYEKLQKPCFVMDTSLSFECLNGFPGPFIKFWYEESVGAEKTCKIANLFNEHGCEFKTILGYFDGQEAHFFEEIVKGALPTEPRGTFGYTWDNIFMPAGETRTFAEMTFEEKHQYSPQAKLFQRLREFLEHK